MKKSLVIGLFLFFIFVQVVSADILEMEIQTLANHRLNIDFLNPDRSGNPLKYDSINEDTGEDGVLNLEFSDTVDVFDMSIFLMKGSEVVAKKTFTEVANDQKIRLFISPQVISIEENYLAESGSSTDTQDSSSEDTVSETGEGLDNETEPISSENNSDSENIDNEDSNTEETSNTNQPNNQPGQTSESSFFEPYSNFVSYLVFGFLFVFVLFFVIGLFGRRLFKAKKGRVGVSKSDKKSDKSKDDKLTEESAAVSEVQKKLNKALEEIEDLKKQKGKEGSDSEKHKKKLDHLQNKHRLLKDIKKKKHRIARQKKELQELEDKLNELHAKKDIV